MFTCLLDFKLEKNLCRLVLPPQFVEVWDQPLRFCYLIEQWVLSWDSKKFNINKWWVVVHWNLLALSFCRALVAQHIKLIIVTYIIPLQNCHINKDTSLSLQVELTKFETTNSPYRNTIQINGFRSWKLIDY